jgi:hypothetical protein
LLLLSVNGISTFGWLLKIDKYHKQSKCESENISKNVLSLGIVRAMSAFGSFEIKAKGREIIALRRKQTKKCERAKGVC